MFSKTRVHLERGMDGVSTSYVQIHQVLLKRVGNTNEILSIVVVTKLFSVTDRYSRLFITTEFVVSDFECKSHFQAKY